MDAARRQEVRQIVARSERLFRGQRGGPAEGTDLARRLVATPWLVEGLPADRRVARAAGGFCFTVALLDDGSASARCSALPSALLPLVPALLSAPASRAIAPLRWAALRQPTRTLLCCTASSYTACQQLHRHTASPAPRPPLPRDNGTP